MSQDFQEGDFLIFQIESGYGLLRILRIEGESHDRVWHLQAFEELFLDVESADAVLEGGQSLTVKLPHVALTHRAFESTQVARMKNLPLSESERAEAQSQSSSAEVSDRSIRLMLGLR